MTNITDESGVMSRRALLGGFAAATVSSMLPAPALALGKGSYRRLRMVNHRTDEWLDTVYWADGEYVAEAMAAIDIILRDWRQNAVKPIAPATIDILSGTLSRLDCAEPLQVVSGYRTPQTNAMLRRSSRGVARKSYHVRGMAVDITLDCRSVGQMARAARAAGAGGVGRYSRSEFVHVDSGPVRDWGR